MSATTTLGKIIIVESNEAISSLLRINLGCEGYEVTVHDSASSVADADLGGVKLIIADAMADSYSGIHLLADIKGSPMTAHVGFIVCSVNDSERLIIEALDAGADDYVIKPFSLRELVARVKSVIRRYSRHAVQAPGNVLRFHSLSVDLVSRRVSDGDTVLTLTKTEYAILELLLKNVNNYVTRIQIYKSVWSGDIEKANDRIVDTNISRLRKKLGRLGSHLVNRSGMGYMMQM